jgi:hypothetical protein
VPLAASGHLWQPLSTSAQLKAYEPSARFIRFLGLGAEQIKTSAFIRNFMQILFVYSIFTSNFTEYMQDIDKEKILLLQKYRVFNHVSPE